MEALPYKYCDIVAKHITAKGVTADTLASQLQQSNSYIVFNKRRIKVSASTLLAKVKALTAVPTTLQNIRSQVKQHKISNRVLKEQYSVLKQEGFM